MAYVNHKNQLVLVNPKGLPALPSDQTYQMWSDVDGEMINMGTFPTDTELVSLKYIENAESLNITIEPAGGSDHPNVEQLVSKKTHPTISGCKFQFSLAKSTWSKSIPSMGFKV